MHKAERLLRTKEMTDVLDCRSSQDGFRDEDNMAGMVSQPRSLSSCMENVVRRSGIGDGPHLCGAALLEIINEVGRSHVWAANGEDGYWLGLRNRRSCRGKKE